MSLADSRYGCFVNVQVMAAMNVNGGVSPADADRGCGGRTVANPLPGSIDIRSSVNVFYVLVSISKRLAET